MFGKRDTQMTRICAFKEKEKERDEGRPSLGGLWKLSMLDGP
jgi:hypothetical protein